jgi:protein transport protein SEC31
VSSFHDLAWAGPSEDRRRGIVAGALDNGCLSMWDADKLAAGGADALISNDKIHSGAAKALQFNPKIPNLVATGGAKGELFVSDLNHPGTPVRLGSTAARADDIDCLDWNKKVSHIMVTGSSGGFVTVWDMKTKKESLTLNNSGRKAVSAVAWDPEKPTRLITAVPLEQEPVILVWDLRNSNAPEKTLRGHDNGVLSLSWCPQDSDLLLSCGKDNRTILWNPQTGQMYGDYPVVTNWTFQTRWNPHNPNLFATASFDGKLQVQSIQNTNPTGTQAADQTQADGEDFFSKAQTQPQSSSFSLTKAPKWLERPVSVSFGFGGRLISVSPSEPGKSRMSKINITTFEVDSDVGALTETFEQAIQSGDLSELCTTRIADAKSEDEVADWKVIKTLVSSNPRGELVNYLGFGDETDEAADGIAALGLDGSKGDETKPQVNGTAKGHKRFSSIFDSTPDGDFLTELAATKGTKTNNPFQIYTGSESEADRRITRALMLGQFEKALDVCLQEDRMSDAFMIAICGGEACTKKAQEAYFAKQSGGPNYLRLLASVVGKNLWDVVHNADLANWKEVMATLCTFANEKEFPDLCEALGDRLEESVQQSHGGRKDASFCFLAGSKLEKVVAIWIEELQENEQKGLSDGVDSSAFSVHARGLQEFIEKVTIFRRVVNFRDTELQKTSDWKLEALYSKYLEYADIVSAHGQMAVAQKYLDLLPATYPGADVARSRISQATKKPQAIQAVQSSSSSSRQKPLPAVGGFPPQPSMFSPVDPQPTPTSYNAAPVQPTNPYAPANQFSGGNPYGGYQPQQQMQAQPPQQFGRPSAGLVAPPPRRDLNQSPGVPAPSKATNMSNWNDIPEGFVKPPTSRRNTPGPAAQAVSSPFPGQQSMYSQTPPPPMAPQYGTRQKSAAPVAPPPKAGAPPRVTSPLTGGSPSSNYGSSGNYGASNTYGPPSGYTPMDRPTSASNSYAPPPSQGPIGQSMIPPPIARGPSPYNAPPSTAPPPNRYAPAPGSQQAAPTGRPSIAPPPQGSSFAGAPPPPNPYASSQPPQQSPSGQYAPQGGPQQSAPRPMMPPPLQNNFAPPPQASAPPPQQQISRPSTAQSEQRSSHASARKFPKGDRSHIAPSAQPIYTILSAEMSRVKARAPAAYADRVKDTEKRLDILYDHLNNEDLLKPDTVAQIAELASALENRQFDRASEIQLDVHQNKVEECGNWIIGVKRLIQLSKASAQG